MGFIPARYYDGEKPESFEVQVAINTMWLEIVLDEKIITKWPIQKIFRDESNLVTVVLGCENFGDARVEISPSADLNHLRTFLPRLGNPPFQYSLKKMVFYFAGMAIFLFLFSLGMKPITKLVAGNISLKTERDIFSKIASLPRFEKCLLDPKQEVILEKVLSKVYPQSTEDERLDLDIALIRNSEVNAFALPGGKIWLFSGLLEQAESPEEIAGIIAHEIEHVKQRHLLQSFIRTSFVTSLWTLVSGDLSGFAAGDPQFIISLLSLKFDRSQEEEADLGAKVRLKKGGLSTRGMIQFFQRNSTKDKFDIPEFLSTHPADEERIKLLQSERNRESQSHFLDDWEWNLLKESCR